MRETTVQIAAFRTGQGWGTTGGGGVGRRHPQSAQQHEQGRYGATPQCGRWNGSCSGACQAGVQLLNPSVDAVRSAFPPLDAT